MSLSQQSTSSGVVLNYIIAWCLTEKSLANIIDLSNFMQLTCSFLYDQTHAKSPSGVLSDRLPGLPTTFDAKVSLHKSAIVMFYAPSNLSGVGGMCYECIYATSDWQNVMVQLACMPENHGDMCTDPMMGSGRLPEGRSESRGPRMEAGEPLEGRSNGNDKVSMSHGHLRQDLDYWPAHPYWPRAHNAKEGLQLKKQLNGAWMLQ